MTLPRYPNVFLKTIILSILLAMLAAACTGAPAPAAEEQRAGAAGMTVIRPTIIDRDDWRDDCWRQMEHESQLAGDDYSGIYSWQITSAETLAAEQAGSSFQWRLVDSPEGTTGLLGNSQEVTTWLCGAEGEYRLDVTTGLAGRYVTYTMQFEVEAP